MFISTSHPSKAPNFTKTMASLKYFLLCPFVFLCLSCTFANRVFNTDDGSGFSFSLGVGSEPGVEGGVSGIVAGTRAEPRAGLGVEGGVSNVEAGPKAGPRVGLGIEGGVSSVVAGPRAGPRAGLGVEGGVSSAGVGPKAGPRARPRTEGGGSVGRGVDPIVNEIGVGVEVGYKRGFGPGLGYWPGSRIGGGGLFDDVCILGYVCPAVERRGCNKFAYENCESYSFHPLTAAMDMHEVEINWAKSKPVAVAQHGVSAIDDAQPTKKAQNGVVSN